MSNIKYVTGISVKLGQKIRTARKALALTQQELGQQVDVSKQSISRWESGDDMPQGTNLLKLTEALGLAPGWFADEADDDVPVARPTPAADPPELDRALRSIRDDFLAGRTVLQAEAWLKRLRHITAQASELMTFPTLAAEADAEARQAVIRDELARRRHEETERGARRARRAR